MLAAGDGEQAVTNRRQAIADRWWEKSSDGDNKEKSRKKRGERKKEEERKERTALFVDIFLTDYPSKIDLRCHNIPPCNIQIFDGSSLKI